MINAIRRDICQNIGDGKHELSSGRPNKMVNLWDV